MRLAKLVSVTLTLLAFAVSLRAASDAIFDEKADAHRQIAAAIAQASEEHKNVVLDFGANWCGDCHALEADMQKPDLAALLAANYVVVNIDVGRMNKNRDLAKQYGIPLRKGIPALAILDSHGKLLYSQGQGQFENARHVAYESIKAFFEQWTPKNGT